MRFDERLINGVRIWRRMEKCISKFYHLKYVGKKNSLHHEIMVERIIPQEYTGNEYAKQINGIYHVPDMFATLHRFTKFEAFYLKPIRMARGYMHGERIISICYTSGSICEDCFCFEHNPYGKYKMPDDAIGRFRNIANRKDLADFIRQARKEAVTLTKHKCESCTRKAKERAMQIELDKLDKIIADAAEELTHEKTKDESEFAVSHLYLMKCERTGFYKIGKSKNPKHREKTLQAESPSIAMIAVFQEQGWQERDWHKYFARHRKRGEWFSLNKVQVAYMCRTASKRKESECALI